MIEPRDDEESVSTSGGSRFGRWLFLVVGTGSMLVGLWQCYTTARLLQHGTTATGHVIGPGAHPEIAFRTTSGAIIRYRQNGMGERPVGTAVPLVYDPAAPADTAVVRSVWQLWLPPLIPLLMGGGFVGLILMGAEVEWRGPGIGRRKR